MPATNAAKKPVYLRGVPSELVREAKAVAARRGVTLAGFVADVLARAVKERAAKSAEGDELSREIRWYERNREQLVRKFAGEYVAILDQAVIDHDPQFEALAERVFAREGARDIFMPRVGAAERTARVRSPRSKQR